MILFEQEIKDKQELEKWLKKNPAIPEKYHIAVIVFAFDQDNKLILQRRGLGCRDERLKLEGIGGGVEERDITFRQALKREIQEEVGENAEIEIRDFLVALGDTTFDERDKEEKYWILLAYIGKLKKGILEIKEPEKNLGFEHYSLDAVPEQELSIGATAFYHILKEKMK